MFYRFHRSTAQTFSMCSDNQFDVNKFVHTFWSISIIKGDRFDIPFSRLSAINNLHNCTVKTSMRMLLRAERTKPLLFNWYHNMSPDEEMRDLIMISSSICQHSVVYREYGDGICWHMSETWVVWRCVFVWRKSRWCDDARSSLSILIYLHVSVFILLRKVLYYGWIELWKHLFLLLCCFGATQSMNNDFIYGI